MAAEGNTGPNTKAIAVQIAIGLVIGLIIYACAYWAMKRDANNLDMLYNSNNKSQVKVFNGYYSLSQLVGKNFTTVNKTSSSYVPIKPSVNIKGGAQFSYNFWLFVNDPSKIVGTCIFLRGDPSKYSYSITDNVNNYTQNINDHVAFCPMLSFGPNPMEFKVNFNTINNVNESLYIATVNSDDSNFRKNLLSLYGNKWVCITIVFEDNMPINDFENGVIVKFYVNDVLYRTGRYSSALVQNEGDLVFFPDSNSKGDAKISNFSYYNYALADSEIKTIVANGPNIKPAIYTSNTVTLPYYVSDYNKLDIYNT